VQESRRRCIACHALVRTHATEGLWASGRWRSAAHSSTALTTSTPTPPSPLSSAPSTRSQPSICIVSHKSCLRFHHLFRLCTPPRSLAHTHKHSVHPSASCSSTEQTPLHPLRSSPAGNTLTLPGFGSIGRGCLPLVLKHMDMPADKITIFTAEDCGKEAEEDVSHPPPSLILPLSAPPAPPAHTSSSVASNDPLWPTNDVVTCVRNMSEDTCKGCAGVGVKCVCGKEVGNVHEVRRCVLRCKVT
jgi:hypothetical protein